MSRGWGARTQGGVRGLEVMQDGPPGVGMARAWPWSLDGASWGVVLASEPPHPEPCIRLPPVAFALLTVSRRCEVGCPHLHIIALHLFLPSPK